jgi:tRNA threonylcarbamoyl adenosine modification protein YeaZ
MLNLAIECSGIAGSIALCRGQDLIAKCQLSSDMGSVQSLAPAIDNLLSYLGPSARRVDLISVTHGPGSFTGLRVGLATAQTLAFAWKIPIAPVDTLAVIAHGVCRGYATEPTPLSVSTSTTGSTIVVPVINAFRKQVFVAAWRMGNDHALLTGPRLSCCSRVAKTQVLDASTWQAQPWRSLNRWDPNEPPTVSSETVLVCGPGLRNYVPLPHSGVRAADQEIWEPTALAVAQLGWNIFLAGETVSAHELRPNYIRASAAEELTQTTTAPHVGS